MGQAETCGDCRFFKRGSDRGGWCRKLPPTLLMVGQAKHPVTGTVIPLVQTYFPETPDDQWCGAYDRELNLSAIDLGKLAVMQPEGEA